MVRLLLLIFSAADSSFPDSINTFESALNAIDVNNAAILSITQQYLLGLNIQAHSESIRVQMSRLRVTLYALKPRSL